MPKILLKIRTYFATESGTISLDGKYLNIGTVLLLNLLLISCSEALILLD